MVEAQYRAGLQGTVSDTTGSVIPNATVTIVDKETNQTQTTKDRRWWDIHVQQACACSVLGNGGRHWIRKEDSGQRAGLGRDDARVECYAAGRRCNGQYYSDGHGSRNRYGDGQHSGNDLGEGPADTAFVEPRSVSAVELAPGALGDSSQSAGGGS